jgi:uncharacterized membrane protein YesL
MAVFRVLWHSIKDLFDELFLLVIVNMLWVLINAPLMIPAFALILTGAIVPGFALALLGVLPMAPATAGLYVVAQRIAEGRATSWRALFAGFREHRALSWRVYGLWMIGLLLILANLNFYSGMGSGLGGVLWILFLYFLLIWFGLLIYIGPLMLLQSDKRIRVIARNAFLLVLGRPVFTLITLILMALIMALSWLLAILPFVLTFSFLTLWSFRVTDALIAEAAARHAAEQEQAAAAAASSRANTEEGRGGQVRPRD